MIDPTVLIIPAFTALRDTILNIRKSNKEELRNWFAAHVEPLDELMRKIYDDYSLGFTDLAGKLRSRADPAQAVELIKNLRLTGVRDRTEVVAVARELANARRGRKLSGLGKDFYDLFSAVESFSVAARPENGLSYYSSFISEFVLRTNMGADPYVPDGYGISTANDRDPIYAVADLLDRCRQTLMPEAWGKYVAAYQRVRLQCV
jgi:hypothetical protein